MSSSTSSSPSPSSLDLCAVCQIPAKQSCSACRLIKYCSVEHQRQHWKQHKTDCSPFRVAKDSELGRYLLATRDIVAGSVVFTEAPLVVGPKWFLNEHDEQVGIMPCVGCLTPTRIGTNCCPRCYWPACSSSCAGLQHPNLHGVECTVLKIGPGPMNRSDIRALMDYYRSDALFVLKCLLLQRLDNRKWKQLLDMQSHQQERMGTELHVDAEKRIVNYLQRNFLGRLKSIEQKSKEKFLQDYSPELLHRICGIIETNYMCISLPTGMELSGVFYTGCMMEHACKPNCYFQFDHKNGFKISIIAGRDIKKGEHLKIMYSNMLWATQLRQEHLAITKHFQCKCDRCCDPTEYGTYFSALLCFGDIGKKCGGIQLPKNPLDLQTDWICDTCPIVISGQEVRYLLTQMSEEVEDLLARKPTVKKMEALIEKLSKFLHPNHYHMFNLKHSLIQLYGTEPGLTLPELNEKQLTRKLTICEEILGTCQRLDPDTIRLSIYVGIIYYEMQTVLVERGKRLLAKPDKTESDVMQAVDGFKVGLDCLLKAAKVLEKELDNVAGSKLSDAVLKAITGLEAIIRNSK